MQNGHLPGFILHQTRPCDVFHIHTTSNTHTHGFPCIIYHALSPETGLNISGTIYIQCKLVYMQIYTPLFALFSGLHCCAFSVLYPTVSWLTLCVVIFSDPLLVSYLQNINVKYHSGLS